MHIASPAIFRHRWSIREKAILLWLMKGIVSLMDLGDPQWVVNLQLLAFSTQGMMGVADCWFIATTSIGMMGDPIVCYGAGCQTFYTIHNLRLRV